MYRELGGYPPVCDILAVLVTSRSRELAENTCTSMAEYIKGVSDNVKVIGPAKAGIGKINDVFRFVFFIKSRDERLMTECKNRLESGIMETGDLQIFFDLNPMNPY